MPFDSRFIAPSLGAMNNAMLDAVPERRAWPRLGWWTVALVLLCFLPRAGLALKKSVICRDGVFYLQLADALAERDWSRGFQTLGLNVYPSLLALMESVGLDASDAGKWWGVALASLTVLPLFGWVRRLFNDRVAWSVAVLYAAHPKLIEWSPELVRDPTFWFLWSLSVYCLVRAVTEVRAAWFALAGVAIALAIHTRFEGWLLYIPFAAWTWMRWRYLVAEQWRLARGALVGVAMYPALLVLVNVTWLHDCPDWQLGSFQRLQYVRWWWEGGVPTAARWPTSEDSRIATGGERVRSTPTTQSVLRTVANERVVLADVARGASWSFALEYLDALRRGFDLGYGLLAGWGIWRGRGLWRRGDYHALLVVGLAIFAAIWIHFWYAGATSSRYVLTVLLLALPWTAIGVLDLTALVAARWQALRPQHLVPPRAVYAGALALVFVVGTTRGLASRDLGIVREAALGQWLGETLGAETPVALARTMPLCAYYAGPAERVTWLDTRDPGWIEFLKNPAIEVAIVEPQAFAVADRSLVEQAWARLEPSDLPAECRAGKFIVMMRRDALGATSTGANGAANRARDDAAMHLRKVPVGR